MPAAQQSKAKPKRKAFRRLSGEAKSSPQLTASEHTRAAHDESSYRADVDGLRAVAVTAVILYHIDKTLLPGGFVGVDVFFVISGFVVSGSLCVGVRVFKSKKRSVLLLNVTRNRGRRAASGIVPSVCGVVAGEKGNS